MNPVELANLAQGAAEQKFQTALQEVVANILDPHTEATAKRSVTLKLDFKPQKNRQFVNVEVSTVVKGAPHKSEATILNVGLKGGKPSAVELDLEQQRLFDDDEDGPRAVANFPQGDDA